MFKKILIVLAAIIIAVTGLEVFLQYRKASINNEKCKEFGEDFIYVSGPGCLQKADAEKFNQDVKERGYNALYEESRMQSQDVRRFSTLNGIPKILSAYNEKFGKYPKMLDELATSGFYAGYDIYEPSTLNATKRTFSYAVKIGANGKVTEYHLGASLEIYKPEDRYGVKEFATDANFNSKTAGWTDGFDGDSLRPCNQADIGKFCYDFTVKVSN